VCVQDVYVEGRKLEDTVVLEHGRKHKIITLDRHGCKRNVAQGELATVLGGVDQRPENERGVDLETEAKRERERELVG